MLPEEGFPHLITSPPSRFWLLLLSNFYLNLNSMGSFLLQLLLSLSQRRPHRQLGDFFFKFHVIYFEGIPD